MKELEIKLYLTEKGQARFETLLVQSLGQRKPGDLSEFQVLVDIRNSEWAPSGRLLDTLIRKGLVKAEPQRIEDYLDLLPRGPLRENMRTYVRIAREEPVGDSEIETLRKSLVEGLRGAEGWKDTRTDKIKISGRVISRLERAETRAEKVIAIDSAIGLVHGEGLALQYGTGTTDSFGGGQQYVVAREILDRLSEGEK